jgi:hypothetical protein
MQRFSFAETSSGTIQKTSQPGSSMRSIGASLKQLYAVPDLAAPTEFAALIRQLEPSVDLEAATVAQGSHQH